MVPTPRSDIFKTPEHRHEWQRNCCHTDGFRDAMGEKPSRAQQIQDAGLRKAYESGWQFGLSERES